MLWDISSVGLERCLDRAEVTGSNPVYPTNYSFFKLTPTLYNKGSTLSSAMPLEPLIRIDEFGSKLFSNK